MRITPRARSGGVLPESDGAIEPSLGTRPGARTKAMTQAAVLVELHFCSGLAQRRDSFLHHRRRSNAIVLTDAAKVEGSLVVYSEWPV